MKPEFLQKAIENKANDDLHAQLIKEHLENWNGLEKSSIEYFFKTGKVSGSLYLALMEYAESYHNAKIKIIEKQQT